MKILDVKQLEGKIAIPKEMPSKENKNALILQVLSQLHPRLFSQNGLR